MNLPVEKIAGAIGRWTRLAALLLAASCAGCCTPGPILSASRPNVIVFRGMAGYFPNLGEFEDKLLEEGICPTVAFPDAHARICERIIAARNTGTLQGPLVIVGYSAGADKAIVLSRSLRERGITVDKLVLLETTRESTVPGNVTECVNIYKPQPWDGVIPVFRGCPVSAASPATIVSNYNVRDYNDGRYDWDNHFTLTTNPYVQDLIIDEVVAGLEAAPKQDGVASGNDQDTAQRAEEVPPPAKD
jgi:hypothetical protein